jgi:hypothetical protein
MQGQALQHVDFAARQRCGAAVMGTAQELAKERVKKSSILPLASSWPAKAGHPVIVDA